MVRRIVHIFFPRSELVIYLEIGHLLKILYYVPVGWSRMIVVAFGYFLEGVLICVIGIDGWHCS